MSRDTSQATHACLHCGDPVVCRSGQWVHVRGPGSYLARCQHTVPYGQDAEAGSVLRTSGLDAVLQEVHAERRRQDSIWGEQNHPDGTGRSGDKDEADLARAACEGAFKTGTGSYRDILLEEVAEAFAESDSALLRAELVQVAAVAVAWVEKIDRDISGGAA